MLIDEFARKFVSQFGGTLMDAGLSDSDSRGAVAMQIASAIRRNFEIHEVADDVGYGSYGAAVPIMDSGWMLKVTTDEDEIRASAVVRGMIMPNVAQVAEAARIAGLPKDLFLGVVINERMEEIGTGDDDFDRRLNHIVYKTVEKIDLSLASYPADDPKRRELLDASSRSLMDRLRAEKGAALHEVADGIEQLRAHGVFVIDTHANNVGYKHTETGRTPIMLFDLGLSSSPRRRVRTIQEP